LKYRPEFGDPTHGRGLSYREGEAIARELFGDPFFTGWFMAGQRVYDFADEYRKSNGSEEVLERFCAELLAPDLELIRERLLSCADLMRRCGRDAGLVARTVALAGSLPNNPLPHHLHPFLRVFALESMEIAREALAQADESGLKAIEEK